MRRKNLKALRVPLYLTNALPASALKPQIKTADTRKQGHESFHSVTTGIHPYGRMSSTGT